MNKPFPRPKHRKAAAMPGWDATEIRGAIACDQIIRPITRAWAAADRKYGIDQLVACLPTEPPAYVAASDHDGYRSIVPRYAELVEAFNVAIAKNDTSALADIVPRLVKAVQIMDAHCEAAGAVPAVQILEVELADGARCGFVLDSADWQRAAAARPDLKIISLSEAAIAVLRCEKLVSSTLTAMTIFPGAEIKDVRPSREPPTGDIDDEIPF